MPSPSVWSKTRFSSGVLGNCALAAAAPLDQGRVGDPGDDVAPVVVHDDRLLVDRPRQARERVAHEGQQEAAQRQRPRRRLHRRRIERGGFGCGARTAVMSATPSGETQPHETNVVAR